jgi:hypothetical protein
MMPSDAILDGGTNMGPVLQLHLDRVQSLHNVLEPWQAGTGETLTVWDAEELVRETLEFCARVRSMWEAALGRAFAEENPSVAALLQEREAIERLLAELSVEVAQVRTLVQTVALRPGQMLSGLERLGDAAKDLEALKAEVAEKWPVRNRAELTEARAAIDRGEGLDLADAFAQIAGVDRDTWLARVQARQQQLSSQ